MCVCVCACARVSVCVCLRVRSCCRALAGHGVSALQFPFLTPPTHPTLIRTKALFKHWRVYTSHSAKSWRVLRNREADQEKNERVDKPFSWNSPSVDPRTMWSNLVRYVRDGSR